MIGALCASVFLLSQDSVLHEFRYVGEPSVKSVHVAGTFNGWNKGVNPLVRQSDNRTWKLSMQLPTGKHQYKFVLDGENWIVDPAAKKNEDDGNGNINSILVILPSDYDKQAIAGDGTLTLSGLRHETSVPDFNLDRGKLRLTLRTRASDVGRVQAIVNGRSAPMRRAGGDDLYERFQTEVAWNGKGAIAYSFLLESGANARYFGPKGITTTPGDNKYKLSDGTFQAFEVPSWVEQTIIYQIFPDRFENGSKANDPKNVTPWSKDRPTGDDIYGGDMAGVAKRASYLKDLGIGTIYFNPIFQSPVIHRYETTDFTKIDKYLGTNQEFVDLTKQLKKMGIGVVLDGVFNHVAPDFPQFVDILKQQQKSKYLDWFYIKSFPVEVRDNPPYEAWWGYKSMPKVNLMNEAAADFMLSVPGFWDKRAEIAGWRLDVANEVPMEFWRKFRTKVKALGADKWIVGEVWYDSSPWLKGDQWDSVMNYPFRDAMLRFVAEGKMTPSQFTDRLMTVYNWYAPQVSRNMMNLLSSHDTARFYTLAGKNDQLMKLAATIQMTWVGTPSIYYGEEVGMEGNHDPDCRRPMRWDLANAKNGILNHYKKLIAARNASRALQSGDPNILFSNDAQGTLGYERKLGADRAVVLVNRSNAKRSLSPDLGGRAVYRDVMTGKRIQSDAKGVVRIDLEPSSAAVLIAAK